MKNRKNYLKYRRKFMRIKEYGSWMKMECPSCGKRQMFFYDKYDTTCCMNCDTWTSPGCDDPDCPFCSKRPSTPSEALWFENRKGYSIKDWRRQNYQHKNDGERRHARRKEF